LIGAGTTAEALTRTNPDSRTGQSIISNLADASAHNLRSDTFVVGSYPEYSDYALSHEYGYYSLPDKAWDVLKDTPNLSQMVNTEVIIRVIEQLDF
jgi:hypothetical protein